MMAPIIVVYNFEITKDSTEPKGVKNLQFGCQMTVQMSV